MIMNSSFFVDQTMFVHNVWRILIIEEEDEGNNGTTIIVNNNNTTETKPHDSQILRDTFASYGTAFLIVFIIFCWVRRKFPKAFNIRGWVEEAKSSIALQQHGFFSWIWQLTFLSDEEIMNECGLDALCVIRLCSMGLKLSGMGIFYAIILMPVYYTAKTSEELIDVIDDGVEKLTTGNIPAGSSRLIATSLVAYVMFGFCLYLILKEFDWFIQMRHIFLRKVSNLYLFIVFVFFNDSY